VNELFSLVNHNQGNPVINPAFPNTANGYWSSTTYGALPGLSEAWVIGFINGVIGKVPKNDNTNYHVRCVRIEP